MVCTRADQGGNNGLVQYQLPVHAAVEGAKICFRALEIDETCSMKHEQFVALMASATDNRYHHYNTYSSTSS